MILIVDSGSTKCDWIAVNDSGQQIHEKIRTKGLNPAILKEKKLRKIILENTELLDYKPEVSHIFFYGAGCGTENPRRLLHQVLQSIFTKADIDVQEDTMAAVRSTLNHDDEAAVVCIMGTGSNCSYYDGNVLHQKVKSLGYSIMDEASGNYYGKELIKGYFFNSMPEAIKVSFGEKYNLDADFIKFNLYKQPNPNAYLANFAEFMFLNKDSEYIVNLIKNGFRVFAKNMILQYQKELNDVPVHFAGSIAYLSQDEIKEVAKELNFTTGNFVKRPIEKLAKYHSKRI
ncbi:hypothetical protein SAMN03097699_1031 [Flavobacteriaceae bacterium MAR_2010_188]|nr:hypothetical protein SAMN03097699_1031 [Flavobacteriaceae bacterium MAR_2010_188]